MTGPGAFQACAALLAVGAVTVAGRGVAQEDWLRVDTAEAYTRLVTDRELDVRDEDARYIARPDGTLTGGGSGHDYVGKWELRKGMVCFTGVFDQKQFAYNCGAAFVAGDVMRMDWALDMGSTYYDMGPRAE
jgi:hypothetical protein